MDCAGICTGWLGTRSRGTRSRESFRCGKVRHDICDWTPSTNEAPGGPRPDRSIQGGSEAASILANEIRLFRGKAEYLHHGLPCRLAQIPTITLDHDD